MSPRRSPPLAAAALLLAACHQGGAPAVPPLPPAPLVLAAGLEEIDPSPTDPITGTVDLARLNVSKVDRVYQLTTPAATPFTFEVLSRAGGNVGTVQVGIAHALDGSATPATGVESIAQAGCLVNGTGLLRTPLWLWSTGDGFARLTIGGQIERPQVFAVETWAQQGYSLALVRVAIGPRSAINFDATTTGNHPGVVAEETLYTSDAWQFGLPTIAVSGDRTSIVTYEGDRNSLQSDRRYEMRLQHEAASGQVTGGGSRETAPDSGHWRDHEIAALFNVLALAHCGGQHVTLSLSFDRGATFAQVVEIARNNWTTRLVQIAMATDYSLAVLFWRAATEGGATELLLVEGRPSAVDPTGSPTWFAFDAPQVVKSAPANAQPLLMGAQWSEGGDLVIGYGFSWWAPPSPGLRPPGRVESRCAVRPWGGEFRDHLVDDEILVPRDPSVALLGSGAALRIFYAYETARGVLLRHSDDAGETWSPGSAANLVGGTGAHTPAVFARQVGNQTRVDLLYLVTGLGSELHASRWDDFGNSARADHRLTTSAMAPSASSNPINGWFGQVPYGWRIKQVAWFGYDAAQDDDQIVVVFDEETFDAAVLFWGARVIGGFGFGNTAAMFPPTFSPASPPPLAAGMTEPVPAPNPGHRHQLKLLRIE